jgi:phage repressor protein C with HTH and peptisase S24 domain
MIDVGRRRVHDGAMYAIGIGETISVKRLELLATGRVRIISDNRAEYPPYEMELADLRILGRIIWLARELI